MSNPTLHGAVYFWPTFYLLGVHGRKSRNRYARAPSSAAPALHRTLFSAVLTSGHFGDAMRAGAKKSGLGTLNPRTEYGPKVLATALNDQPL